MKPVFQQTQNDCYSACIASIFDLDLVDVPNFFNVAGYDRDAWWDAVRSYLRTLGYGVVSLTMDRNNLAQLGGFLICSGSPVNRVEHMDTNHATVWYGGEMIHDPHPSGAGIKDVECIDVFYPLNPSRMVYLGPQNGSV